MVTFNVDWAVTIHHHSLQHSCDLSKPVSHELQDSFTLSHHSIHNHHKLWPTRIHDFLSEGNSYAVLHDFRKQWWSDLLSIHIIIVHIITHNNTYIPLFIQTEYVYFLESEMCCKLTVSQGIQQSDSAAWNDHFPSKLSHLSWSYWGHWTFSHLAWYSKCWSKKWLSMRFHILLHYCSYLRDWQCWSSYIST